MKSTRKGFTLVELLIVVGILSALTASMTVAVGGSTAKAKAASIAANVDACKSAVAIYVINNKETGNLSDMTADDILKKCMPTWADFGRPARSGETMEIKYSTTNGRGPNNWAMTVDFSDDPERDEVKSALKKIKGYDQYYPVGADGTVGNAQDIFAETGYAFEVLLSSGKVQPIGTSTSSTSTTTEG